MKHKDNKKADGSPKIQWIVSYNELPCCQLEISRICYNFQTEKIASKFGINYF